MHWIYLRLCVGQKENAIKLEENLHYIKACVSEHFVYILWIILEKESVNCVV